MSNTKNNKVVVTCCHTRVGYNVACGLLKAGWEVIATGRGVPSMCAHLKGVIGDYEYLDPFENPNEYLGLLSDVAEKHDACVILPVHEDLFVASRYRHKIKSTAHLLAPEFDELLAVHDKALIPSFAKLANIRVPETAVLNNAQDVENAIADMGLPCLIKPRSGSGSQGIMTFKTEEDLSYLRGLSDDYLAKEPCLLQEWVEGVGAGVNMLLKDGKVQAICGHQRLREVPIKNGVGSAHVSLENKEMMQAGREFIEQTPFKNGVVMVEFRYDKKSNKFYVIEVNPRYWASITNALVSGLNFPDLHINSLVYGHSQSEPALITDVVESRFVMGEIKYIQELISLGRWKDIASVFKRHSKKPLMFEDFGMGGWRSFYRQVQHVITSVKVHKNFGFQTKAKDDFFLSAYKERNAKSKQTEL
jgi:predicted ATP-grasp superfamily ATP-dependent carboligase